MEMGCGTARNLIAIARRYPQARLYGLDASEEMLETAQHRRAPRPGSTTASSWFRAYAEDLTPGTISARKSFRTRAVFLQSFHDPGLAQGALAAARALWPARPIHVVDFGDLTGLGPAFAGAHGAWLRLFHVKPRVEFLEAWNGIAGRGHGTDASSRALRLYLIAAQNVNGTGSRTLWRDDHSVLIKP